MRVIGLTGSFGSGKTFVASILRSLGATVLDADRIAHRLLKTGSPVYRKVVKEFGADILNARGGIDRRRLGDKVFCDARALRRLNRIVHPEVICRIREKIATAKSCKAVVVDAPLLIEAGLDKLADTVIVVSVSRRLQLARCMAKSGLSRSDCALRIRNQMPLNEKIKRADYVVNNNGTKRQTKEQVMKVWRKLWR